MTEGRFKPFIILLTTLNVMMACLLLWHLRHSFLPVGGMMDASGMFMGRDFVNFWVGGHIFATGDTQRLFDVQAYHQTIFSLFGRSSAGEYIWSYPPHFGLLLIPLHGTPYTLALLAFEAASLLFLLAAVRAALPASCRQSLPFLLLATSPVILPVLYMGQNGFLSAACIIGAFAWRDKKPWLAALCLSLLTYKPQLGAAIALALLVLGAWRVWVTASIVTIAWIAVSVIFYGTGIWENYLAFTLPHHAAMFETYSREYYMLSPAGNFLQWGIPAGQALRLHITLSALVALVLCIALRRLSRPEWQLLLIALATFLFSPYAQGHDAVAVNAALVVCLFSNRDTTERWLLIPGYSFVFCLLWILPVLAIPSMFSNLCFASVVLLLGFVYMAVLLLRFNTKGISASHSGQLPL